VPYDMVGRWPPQEGLGTGERSGGVVGLVRTVEREVHVVVAGIRREQVDEAPAVRGTIARDAEVVAACFDLPCAVVTERARQGGIRLSQHERRPALDDAGFLGRDLLTRRTEVFDVV